MKRTKMFLLVTAILLAVFLSGCGQKNTVEAFVVSTVQYTEKADIESAAQPGQVEAGVDIYASVYFIESPEGMEYTGKWYIDGTEIKSDPQKTTMDKCGAIVFVLEADSVTVGTLKFEVVYNDDVLCSKELNVT